MKFCENKSQFLYKLVQVQVRGLVKLRNISTIPRFFTMK